MAHIEATPRIAVSVLKNTLRIKVVPFLRRSPLLNELINRGRVKYNAHGDGIEWMPRFRRQKPVAGTGNPVALDFPAVNRHLKATLPWRQYDMGQNVTKYEILVSQNPETAVIDIFDMAVKAGLEDFTYDLCRRIYFDGNATSTARDLHGLESWFSVSGCVTNSKVGNPNDLYAGLYTTLGYYGGGWVPDTGGGFPTGEGDAEYAAWTPLVVDYTNAGWVTEGATAATWPYTWRRACRYLVGHMGALTSEEPHAFVMNRELSRQAKDSLEANDRFLVTATSGAGNTDVGHKKLSFEGTDWMEDVNVPGLVGYCLNFDYLTMMSLQGQLIDTSQDEDITASTKLIAMDAYIQLMCESPAFQGKLQPIS